jgi:hypothetical protein
MNARNPMTKSRLILLASLVSGMAMATGCSSMIASCKKAPSYADEKDLPPLRIPVGMDAPDTREALAIPVLEEPEVPRGPNDGCLEEPPKASFVATPPTAAGAEEPAEESGRKGARIPRGRPGQ